MIWTFAEHAQRLLKNIREDKGERIYEKLKDIPEETVKRYMDLIRRFDMFNLDQDPKKAEKQVDEFTQAVAWK